MYCLTATRLASAGLRRLFRAGGRFPEHPCPPKFPGKRCARFIPATIDGDN